MTLREKQDEFISDMEMFDTWADRFNYLISLAEELPAEFPYHLLPFRIEGCQSKTCFKAYSDCYGNIIFTDGWSNSAVMGGIIVAIMKIFNWTDRQEIEYTTIDFHTESGLIDNLTPMRKAALEEIIHRITVLFK